MNARDRLVNKGTLMLKLVVHPERCSGCRMCEVLCSFHHTRAFGRKRSSILVKREERKGEFRIVVTHENVGKNGPPSCNFCIDEEEALCVKFCSTGALDLQEKGK